MADVSRPVATVILIYDGECPLCRNFAVLLRLKRSLGELRLVNAREDKDWMQRLTGLKLDLDQGIVLVVDQRYYYGADAMHRLALLSSRSNLFNQLNYHIFKSRTLSTWLYPVLRFGRNTLLKLLRKGKINNLGKADNSHF